MSETWHVYPEQDLIEHVTEGDGDCPCGPEIRPETDLTGAIHWIHVHHSLDGRERSEP